MNSNNLPAAYFHRSMSGALIPHAVNPGPQLACTGCGNIRFGSDFRMVDAKPVCVYCTGGRS